MTSAIDTIGLNISYEGLFVDGLIDNDEKVAASKKRANSRLDC